MRNICYCIVSLLILLSGCMEEYRGARVSVIEVLNEINSPVAIYFSDGSTIQIEGRQRDAIKIEDVICPQVLKVVYKDGNLNYIDPFYVNVGDTAVIKVYQDDEGNNIAKIESKFTKDVFENINQVFLSFDLPHISVNERDSIYMDSLHNILYPRLRTRIIEELKKEIFLKYDDLVKIEIIEIIYRNLYNENTKPDDDERKEFIKTTEQVINPDDMCFDIVQRLLQRSSNIKDIELIDRFKSSNILNTNKILASIRNYDFTVVNIWTSSCAPCRKFNQSLENKSEILRDKGINVIHVNADYFKENWNYSSDYDGLSGDNLFEGPYSNIVSINNPENTFPKKILFKRGGQEIELPLKSFEDLNNLK